MGTPGEDVQSKLDEIVALVEAGKTGALSATTVKLDRVSLLGALDELRELLPREIADARALLRRREEIIQEATTEAGGILAAARSERDRLVEATEVLAAAEQRAAAVVTAAGEQAASMRAEVDEYADGRLAAFEAALIKTLTQVQHGRDRLRGTTIDLRERAPRQAGADESADDAHHLDAPVG